MLVQSSMERLDRFKAASGSKKTSEIRLRLQKAMQEHCAVFRTEESMEEGVEKITDIADSIKDIAVL